MENMLVEGGAVAVDSRSNVIWTGGSCENLAANWGACLFVSGTSASLGSI